jgi:hypothetical protein
MGCDVIFFEGRKYSGKFIESRVKFIEKVSPPLMKMNVLI